MRTFLIMIGLMILSTNAFSQQCQNYEMLKKNCYVLDENGEEGFGAFTASVEFSYDLPANYVHRNWNAKLHTRTIKMKFARDVVSESNELLFSKDEAVELNIFKKLDELNRYMFRTQDGRFEANGLGNYYRGENYPNHYITIRGPEGDVKLKLVCPLYDPACSGPYPF